MNSENDKNLQSDSWRFYQLDKSLANPDHDYSKFGTGELAYYIPTMAPNKLLFSSRKY